MAPNSSTAVHSWEELQERIGSIVARLNDDLDLAVAAAASPFLALEELGYHVVPEARPGIEDRLRFPAKKSAMRKRLRKAIFEHAGRELDLQSAEALHQVLFVDLSITPYPDARGCIPEPPDTHPLPLARGREPAPDPLGVLEGRHPIIEPLLEYRRLDASRPRFAPQSAYEAIRQGTRSHGIRNVRIRLKGGQGGRRDSRSPGPTAGSAHGERPAGAGPVTDVNAASAEQLESLPGIGARLAARIVTYREEHGRFGSPDALTSVPGVSDPLLAKLRPHITTEPSKAGGVRSAPPLDRTRYRHG